MVPPRVPKRRATSFAQVKSLLPVTKKSRTEKPPELPVSVLILYQDLKRVLIPYQSLYYVCICVFFMLFLCCFFVSYVFLFWVQQTKKIELNIPSEITLGKDFEAHTITYIKENTTPQESVATATLDVAVNTPQNTSMESESEKNLNTRNEYFISIDELKANRIREEGLLYVQLVYTQ